MQNDGFWSDRNVFVTGASGFLGGWLLKSLISKGANPICLVRDEVPKSMYYYDGLNSKCVTVRGRLEDLELLKRALNDYNISHVFHLGAQTQVLMANRYPPDTFMANIMGTWNMLEACRGSKQIEGIVVASTDKAYGSQSKLPYNEETPMEGEHPYDVSKSCTDLIARSYFKTYGLPVGITRCGNFYGGGDLNFDRIVPGTIKSVLKGKRPVIRSDGKYIRDYFYIEDAASAYITLGENVKQKEIMGEAFNFGNNDPKTVMEITELMSKLMGSKLKPDIRNESSGEIRKQYLSSEKANRLLKWKPKYSLEEGLKRTIGWYTDFFKKNGLAKTV
ncbi:MAG: GDP-mannose 4,6-dehydratase [Candidatus Micrarchaeota archaeon]